MSGTNTGRAPRSDPELARDLTRRIKTLENPSSVRVGSWVITEADDGSLIASQPGKSFTLDAIPEQVTTFLTQATGGAGGGLYNIAEFLTAFTSATGIDLLDILGSAGGDVGDLPDVVAQIQNFLTGWLAGLDVDPTLATPGPLLDWFNSQLPDNVILELTGRALATAQELLDSVGLQLSDLLGLLGLDTGGDPGGLLGWLGNLFGGNLPPITPPAGDGGDHPPGWEFWMDYWPPWVERQSGESTGQAWDRLLAAGKRPFPPFPFVLWAASFGDPAAAAASPKAMSQAATLAAAAINALGDVYDPDSPIPGYITTQTKIVNTLTEIVSTILGFVGITLHSDLPGGEAVGNANISQVLTGLWGNPTGTTAGSLASQLMSSTPGVGSSDTMNTLARAAATVANAVATNYDPNSPIPGDITIQTQIMNTLIEAVSTLLSFVGITLHSDLPGGEMVGNANISQVLTGLWGNPTGTTAGPLMAQMASAATDVNVDTDLLNQVLGFAGALMGGGLRGSYDSLLQAFGLCDTRSAATTGLGSMAVAAVNALSNPTGMTAAATDPEHPYSFLGGLFNFGWHYGKPPWEGLSGNLTGLAGNPTGTSKGSLTEQAGWSIWNAINCQGATGQGFALARDVTGMLGDPTGNGSPLTKATDQLSDLVTKLIPLGINIIGDFADVYGNPTGNSNGGLIASVLSLISAAGSDAVGSVGFRLTTSILVDVLQFVNPESASSLGFLLDLVTSLFGSGGKGFNILASIVNDLVGNPTGIEGGNIVMGGGNFCGALMTLFFGGGLTEISRIAADILGIFGNPQGYEEGSLFGRLLAAIGGQVGEPGSWVFAALRAVASGNVSSMIGFLFSPASASGNNSASVASGLITSAATSLGLGDTTAGGGGLIGTASTYLTDFMGLFGSPDGLGTGNVILNTVEDIPIFGPLIAMLFQGLGGIGGGTAGGLRGMLDSIPLVGTLVEMLPLWILNMLGPGGAGTSILPDPNFNKTYGPDIQGAGQWCWAWPGPQGGGGWGSPGCVRTIRPGVITIYYIAATWELFPGQLMPFTTILPFMNDPADIIRMYSSDSTITNPEFITNPAPPLPGPDALDWSRFEFIHIPHSGPVFPMGLAAKEATAYCISLIKQIPGKFILMGGSQGGAALAAVYNEIRFGGGELYDRNDDLIAGFSTSSICREKGRSFPGGPLYCPEGEGAWNPLSGTEERWWEWACTAGTYPAFGDPEGVTFTKPDPFSCLGEGLAADAERAIIANTMNATDMSQMTGELLTILQNSAGFTAILEGIGISGGPLATPHAYSASVVQPWLDQGDTRTYVQIVFDYINNVIGPTYLPTPPAPVRHFMSGVPINVTSGQIVTAGAKVNWMHVGVEGRAIMFGLNIYDADNGNLIETADSAYDETGQLLISMVAPSTIIAFPVVDSLGWRTLSAEFQIPPGSHYAVPVLDVEPEATRGGIVFFGEAKFELPGGTIDAAMLANMENIPTIPTGNVDGTHGMDSLESTLQHMVANLSTAFNRGEEVLEANFPTLFTLAQGASTDAAQALALVKTLVSGYHEPVQEPFITPGEHPFVLPHWMQFGDMLELVVCSAGAAGGRERGGMPGQWSSLTVALGITIPEDTTTLTVTVGAGGVVAGDHGGNGGATIIAASGVELLRVPGGLGGAKPGNTNHTAAGPGPGNFTYGGRAYFGGAPINTGPGNAPGGAGVGAEGWFGTATPGAYGGAWVTAIQRPRYTVGLSGQGTLTAVPLLNVKTPLAAGRGALSVRAWDILKPRVYLAGRGTLAGNPQPALRGRTTGHGALTAVAHPSIRGAVHVTATATYTLTTAYDIFEYTGAGPAAWTLYGIAGNTGNLIVIRNSGGSTMTVARGGTDLIDNLTADVTSFTLPKGGTAELVNNGSRWVLLHT